MEYLIFLYTIISVQENMEGKQTDKQKTQVLQRVCEDFLPKHVLNMFHKLR